MNCNDNITLIDGGIAYGRTIIRIKLEKSTNYYTTIIQARLYLNDICDVLTEILESNVLVVSKKGKVLGKSRMPELYSRLEN